jgi:hypothetical protein
MVTCEICGTEFDELGVQIVLPGLAKSFDRIGCALRARALAGPSSLGGTPLRRMLVDLSPRPEPRLYALRDLPAGLAAAVAGGRTRVALGGASVAVALLVATTVHLSSRAGARSDASARPATLPSPARHGGDFAQRRQAAEVPTAAAPAARPPREAVRSLLAVEDARPPAERRKPATRSARTARIALTSAAESVSSRPGWGWGDKNHAHVGPGKRTGSAKLGKAHGHKK